MGPRSDFSKPCQGAAEKSANATRKALTTRFRCGAQPVGMSNNRLRFTVRREDSNKAAARSAASKATARLCLACGCQPVGMSNKRTTVHPGKNRTVLKPVKHIRVLVFLFSVRREDSSYPFLFFIQMRYSPSVMRVSRYRMGVQHACRMGMGRLPVA